MSLPLFKILVVDDDTDLLFLGSSLLQHKGFDVCSLANAEDVFEVVRAFKPDLILLDIKLGNYDGRHICSQLKNNSETKDIKIILYSAFPETQYDYQEYGANDFLLKPYEIDHLVERINNLLNREFVYE